MQVMESVTLENFRCFREKQTVKLAPLTLLVGENSTGKTSFLALVRAINEFAFAGRPPNFKTPPYDLGSFDEIAHYRGGSAGRAESFRASAKVTLKPPFLGRPFDSSPATSIDVDVTFRRQLRGTAPRPAKQRLSVGGVWVEEVVDDGLDTYEASIGTPRGEWKLYLSPESKSEKSIGSYFMHMLWHLAPAGTFPDGEEIPRFAAKGDSPDLTEEDRESLEILSNLGPGGPRFFVEGQTPQEPFASAPVRSQPHRTYDPESWIRVPEGDHIPMRMAEMSAQQTRLWRSLKRQLEEFGEESGLFDQVRVRHLGKSGSDPFQIQVRKGGTKRKGPFRNLIDVGYGVSQVLPIVTEMMESSKPTELFLYQQPEVHLHPTAQAALGTLLARIAAGGSQLIIETHSDHLIDRIRMDVRDKRVNLSRDDVRILYFEQDELDVKIHEITYDKMGNLLNTPQGYRSFFMKEIERSLWPPE